jgi:hypothetical protein
MIAAPPSSFAELLGAWSTLGIGVIGVVVTVWQFRKSAFRPKLTARMDAAHEACELRIVNRGRTTGVIGQVLVGHAKNEFMTDVRFDGFTDGLFTSVALPALASMRLLIEAPPQAELPRDLVLVVDVGAKKPRTVKPAVMEQGIGLYGLQSVLPPGAS